MAEDPTANGTVAAAAAVRPWASVWAGCAATLVGNGLARFAYTPLIPALIAAGWFTPADAAYLGAANLAGYLVGALLVGRFAGGLSAGWTLRAMMLLATVGLFACAWPLSFLWYFVWRFTGGLAGGVLMTLAAPTVLPYVAAGRRGVAAGVVFTGVGIGIAVSGPFVALLLRAGLFEAWCALGALSLALTALAWWGWPRPAFARHRLPRRAAAAAPANPALWALYVAYGLFAAGLVPHMVFLVDFVARGLDRGIDAGSWIWVVFGIGAVSGPVLLGALADRIGFAAALRAGLLATIPAVLLPALASAPHWLALSSVVAGAALTGMVPLVLGRVRELVPEEGPAQSAAWAYATAGFAVGQAVAAYTYSFIFARSDNHALLFALGAGALFLALTIVLRRGGRQ
jgi:predicted MFS family arabinose efflux permease